MKKNFRSIYVVFAIIISFLLFLSGCDLALDPPYVYDPIDEDFDDEDMPSYETYTYEDEDGTSGSYSLMLPWNYDKDYNSDRSYPILINVKYMSSFLAGDSDLMQDYPCFCLDNVSYNTWSYSLIAELVETYRIDTDTIYLVGFSAGGSGSYPLASGLESYQGLTVAGIIRCAGGSNTSLSDAISSKTSVWYHVGLADSYDYGYSGELISEDADNENRISNQAYEYVKALDSSDETYESVSVETISGYECTTTSLIMTYDDVNIFKKSHYTDMEHTCSPVYANADVVLEWLFNQHLSNRD
ncbi:MAG: hypothetical protein PQJ59_18530 [Spirochaetales bacterium]|nr:hypothetical protein [Spirochaetales bacterium]